MAARVSDAEVKEILDTSISTTPFITAANLIVNQHLLNAALSDELLTEIERWLAAHLACMRDPRLRDAATEGGTRASYERGAAGKGLDATSYGQQVKLLDPTGLLNKAMDAVVASFKVD